MGGFRSLPAASVMIFAGVVFALSGNEVGPFLLAGGLKIIHDLLP